MVRVTPTNLHQGMKIETRDRHAGAVTGGWTPLVGIGVQPRRGREVGWVARSSRLKPAASHVRPLPGPAMVPSLRTAAIIARYSTHRELER